MHFFPNKIRCGLRSQRLPQILFHDCRKEFFKDAGEVVDVRFSYEPDGRFKGFGHVEFATAEAAQKVSLYVFANDLLMNTK